MYRYVYSVAGFYEYGRDATDIAQVGGASFGSSINREVLRLSTRNAYFVMRDLAFGAELGWDQAWSETTPAPNPLNSRTTALDRRIFIGPWVRWYMPVGMRWYTALEASVGYAHSAVESEQSTSVLVLPRNRISAHGIGGKAGLAFGYLLGRSIALDLTARYNIGYLEGTLTVPGMANRDVTIDTHEFSMLGGIQLLF